MSRWRFPLAAAIVMTGLLSVVNVHAYKTANVNEKTTLTVVRTDSAALAITSSDPLAVLKANGMVGIDFSYGGKQFRLSSSTPTVAADVFQMRKIVKVSNTTSDCFTVSVSVPGANAVNLTDIWGHDNAGTAYHLATTGGLQGPQTFNMGISSTNTDLYLDFYWTAGGTATRNTFNILVSAAKRTCP
jgi:hypothetical protein